MRALSPPAVWRRCWRWRAARSGTWRRRRGCRRHLDRATVRGHHGVDDAEPQPAATLVAAAARDRCGGSARRCGARGRAGMPGPWSMTSMTAVPPSTPSDTSMGVPGGVWTSALRTRLPSTWRRRMSSPMTCTGPSMRAVTCGGVGGAGVRARVGHEGAEVNGGALQRASLVEPGEQEQVVDEHAHAPRLLLDAPGGQRDVILGHLRVAAEQLGVAAHRRQRGAQLVRRVGDEVAQALLVGGAFGERRLELAEHGVDGQAQPAHLGHLGRLGSPAGSGRWPRRARSCPSARADATRAGR